MLYDKGLYGGDFFPFAIAAGGSGVAAFGVCFEEDGGRRGLIFSQACDPFGGFPIGDARVVESCGGENGRIVCGLDGFVGSVRADAVEDGSFLRIAPFLVFKLGEGKAWIEHGIEDIDKGNFGDDDPEQFRFEIQCRADKEAPGTGAMEGDASRLGPPFLDEVFGTSEAILKGVGLIFEFASLIPVFTEESSTTDMGNGNEKATLEPCQP